jgi:hypothetical protein
MILLVAADSILRQISSLTVGTMVTLARKTIWALMSSDPIARLRTRDPIEENGAGA